MDFLQIFTLATGIAYMILEVRQKNFMWVVGIATSVAAMWVFFLQGLYASFALNTYYLITSFIGLWHWHRDKKSVPSVVSDKTGTSPSDVIVLNRLTWKTVAVSIVVTAVGILALSWGMKTLNDCGLLKENPMSILDYSVAVLSAVATWWLVRSYIQQWWLWIVADALSVLLCVMQGMWWMTALYIAYVTAAVIGFFHWKKCGIYLTDY